MARAFRVGLGFGVGFVWVVVQVGIYFVFAPACFKKGKALQQAAALFGNDERREASGFPRRTSG